MSIYRDKAEKILTNYFNKKMESVDMAIMPKFQFSVRNSSQSRAVRVALLAAFFETKALAVTKANDVVTGVSLHNHDVSRLKNAGFNINTVLDDATVSIESVLNLTSGTDNGEIIMSASDPAYTINDFRNYIKTNPRYVKELTIVSSSTAAFGGVLERTVCDVFGKEKVQQIELKRFYKTSENQNVDDRITIPFADKEMELSDISLLVAIIPANCQMDFTFRFAEIGA